MMVNHLNDDDNDSDLTERVSTSYFYLVITITSLRKALDDKMDGRMSIDGKMRGRR